MKVAVSSTGKDVENNISDVFGRCPYFIIAQIKDNKIENIEVIKNESINQNSGAGISAAQLLVEKDVNIVIASNVGPRAQDVLKQFNIEIYTGQGRIKDILQEFIDKKLKKIN
ncbi:NifB/NifX family molybdenum-iron cluster-binding protein [Candidatus Falkowbacteria bacterium]|nr:NifB/NifX family molybdenum-iron cluster-binding protein [Candidatus Falkowbacteria bacterium]